MGGKTQSAITCVSATVLKRPRSRCLETARGSRVCGISPWMADRDWEMRLTCLREIPSECWGGAWTIQVRTWNWVSGEVNSKMNLSWFHSQLCPCYRYDSSAVKAVIQLWPLCHHQAGQLEMLWFRFFFMLVLYYYYCVTYFCVSVFFFFLWHIVPHKINKCIYVLL